MSLYWTHPTSQILHRTTFGSAMFLCGRAFGTIIGAFPLLERKPILFVPNVLQGAASSDETRWLPESEKAK